MSDDTGSLEVFQCPFKIPPRKQDVAGTTRVLLLHTLIHTGGRFQAVLGR